MQEFRSTHFKWAGKRRFSGKHNFSWKKWCKHCRLRIICDELLFREIDFFLVKPLTTLTDHSQIITWLNIKSTLSFHKGNELDLSTLKKLPTQFIWVKDSANLFNQALISSRTQTLIVDFINCEFPVTEKGIDEAVESFESILHSAASQSLKRKIVKRRRKNINIITKKMVSVID